MKKQSPTKILLLGILMMVLCVLSAKYVLFTALLLPFIGAYATAKLPPSWSAVYYLAAAAACFIILPDLWIIASLMILFSSLLTGIAVRKRVRTYEGVILSCAGWVLAFGVIIAASYIVYGTDPLTMIVDKIRLAVEQSDSAATLAYSFIRTPEIIYSATYQDRLVIFTDIRNVLQSGKMDVIREFVLGESGLAYINNFLALNIPTTALQYSLIGGLLSYLLARFLMKRSGETVAPIPALKDFKLPKNLTTPLAIVFALGLGVSLLDLPLQIYTACSILVNACSVVFAVQSITLIHWFISLRSKNKGTTIALSIVIPIAAAMFNALPWLGFFEMVFKIRYNVIIRPIDKQ